MTLLRPIAALAAVAFLVLTGIVAAIYDRANGLTAGALVLSTLPLIGALGFVATRHARPLRRRRVIAAMLVVTALDLVWVLARMSRSGGEGLRVCVNTACDGRGSFWQRVPDEREAARAGLQLSSLGGAVGDAEFRAFDRLLDAEYARVPKEWRGLPNALLMRSTPSRIESHRWVPEGAQKAPCIVFLHGYGGALTIYLRTIVESEIGKKFVVVAPALDNLGVWRGERGREVIENLVEHQLPAEVDRSRVYLVGLSNGSVAASELLRQPSWRARFKGFVLISGTGAIDRTMESLQGTRVLTIAGRRDPRFPFAFVEQAAQGLRMVGADVELAGLDADHYLILTHAEEWTARFLAWEGSRP